MIINSYKSLLEHYLINYPGWRTKRRIVVIVSDDWGSIRMPSLEVYNELQNSLKIKNLSPYLRYDSLESDDDLEYLFDVLYSIRDKNGNHPVITANTIMANPAFKKIELGNFRTYHYEPFTETYQRYPCHNNVYQLWRKGIDANIFFPQFHGREHLNVFRWLNALQSGIEPIRTAFKYELFDLSLQDTLTPSSFMGTLNFDSKEELPFLEETLKDGLRLFEEVFGFKSKSFIAPSYIWSKVLEKTLAECGVSYIQSNWYQLEPVPQGKKRFRKRFHFTGQTNSIGQTYLVRNAHFEPSQNPDYDYRNDILRRAKIVFSVGKPLIISSHRLNFIGSINELNRSRNLTAFKHLLKDLIRQWPDIEFINLEALGGLIR